MNARQKAKKLKKVINMIESDLGISNKWLKIDSIRTVPDEQLWYSNDVVVRVHEKFEITIGSMKLICDPYYPNDKIVWLDTKAYINSIRRRCGIKEE